MTPDIDHQQLVKGTRMNDRCPIRRVNRRRFLQTIISSGAAAGGVWEVLEPNSRRFPNVRRLRTTRWSSFPGRRPENRSRAIPNASG